MATYTKALKAMLRKKTWIPIFLMLTYVVMGGVFWGQHLASHGLSETHVQLLEAETEKQQTEVPVAKWQPKPPPQADDIAAEFIKPDAIYNRVRGMYIAWHYHTYPDCPEHEAVLADAQRYTKWLLVDRNPKSKSEELTDELVSFLEKYNYSPVYEATHIPESERLKDIERIKFLMAELEALDEQRDVPKREKPTKPRPQHTH